MKLSLFSLPVWLLFGLFGFQATKGMSQCNVDVATSLVFSQGEPTEGYGLSLEAVAEHTTGDLAGLTTYWLYMQTAHPTDRVIAVVGDDEFPLSLMPETAFYQDPAGNYTPNGISPAWFLFFPDLAYDSWVTVGLDEAPSSSDGEEGVTMLFASGWESVFESGQGFVSSPEAATGWAVVPWTATNTIAGPEQRVLLAQLTTDGHLSGSMRVQVFPQGDNENDLRLDVTFNTDVVCGCTDSNAANFDAAANADDGSCVFGGCTDPDACNYDATVAVDDGSCLELDVVGVCGGNCVEDDDNNGVCDADEVLGCTYELADNYDTMATRDDGLCEFPCSGDINQNVFDWDGDSAVTIADFLAMLAVFGDVDVDSDGVWDSQDACTDLEACNYAATPSEPCAFIDVLGACGGGCEGDGDGDGICDDVDTCVGELDECGVCNGPGPTEVVIEDIVITYDSVFLPLDDDWYVFPISADTTFGYTCAPLVEDCGIVNYQGYDYATVLIGEQCWFAENLRSENYKNGDAIPAGLSDDEWFNTSSGAVAVYGEGSSSCVDQSPDGDACNEAWSLNEYGRLYNWYAVDDARGLCPSGWHFPTDVDWITMEMTLGMSESQANQDLFRGTDQGTQMKMDFGWTEGGNGTNSSGFAGLPAGARSDTGIFVENGESGYWWVCQSGGGDPWGHFIASHTPQAGRFQFSGMSLRLGLSVRCVQDSE